MTHHRDLAAWPQWPSPVLNASGPLCTTFDELKDIALSPSGGIVTKSMTHCPREGNPLPRLHQHAWGSLNSMGLPNLGYEAYAEMFPQLRQLRDKPIVASLAFAPCRHELDPAESYLEMAQALDAAGADLLEVNLSCPNLEAVPIGLDAGLVEAVLAPLIEPIKTPISVKVPPYNNDPRLFEAIAKQLVRLRVDAITTMNSEPGCLDIDLETQTKVLKPNEGFGGLGGRSILPIALAEVHRFHRYFQANNASIKVIGVGGIATWQDALKHFLAGASLVQVGTAYLDEGTSSFERIWSGVQSWLSDRDLTLEHIIGAVKDQPSSASDTVLERHAAA